MSPKVEGSKIKTVLQASEKAGFQKYRELFYGNVSLRFIFIAELLSLLIGSIPGATGLLLRSKLYPYLFGNVDGTLFIGRNVTLRHPRKIRLGKNVTIDDNCVIDAKGLDNEGITIGDNVFLGRNTIVYCKNGNIHIKKGVNISANCTLFSSNQLTMEASSVVGAYSYLLSGGEYDYSDTTTKFVDQTGMETKGELVIGSNCWLGARVTVIDAASIGNHCVIGAGSVVTRPIPSNSLAFGVPARVKKSI
jgi:acetyltransferase-like isoleucine patch superfamily enzyme